MRTLPFYTMHIIVQFPIIDYRPLLPNNGGRLSRPGWPSPSLSNKPFIRKFGAVEERNKGGNLDFSGEAYYCNAHHCLRYHNLHKQGVTITEGRTSAIHNSYRRFYSDGYFVGKIEAGFVDNTEKELQEAGLTGQGINLENVLNHYAKLAVKVDGVDCPLYKAGPLLAKSYYVASTEKNKEENNWKAAVAAGEICIMAVFPSGSGINLPKNAFQLETFKLQDDRQANLYGYKLRSNEYRIKVWLLETPSGTESANQLGADILRNLRVYILRVHLEKETMRLLLDAIKNGPVKLEAGSQEAQLADAYFKKAGEKLFKKERFQLSVQKLIDFALHSEEAVDPGNFSTLQEGVFYFQDLYTRRRIKKALAGMKKKKVLFICASPRDQNPLDFGREYRQIIDALQASIDKQNFEQNIYTSVKKAELLDILTAQKPDYLHISMHSSLKNGLCFEDHAGALAAMSVEDFKVIIHTFSQQYTMSAVLLSACNSGGHARAIQGLCQKAIGTNDVFPADAGIVYAGGFYNMLFSDINKDIQACHTAGQQAIRQNIPPFQLVNKVEVEKLIQLF